MKRGCRFRLKAICELMEMGFADLVRMMEERQHRIAHLTEEQEQELVANIKLLLVAMCARNHWTFETTYPNIAEPIEMGNAIAMEPVAGRYAFIANDGHDMAVALIDRGESIDQMLSRLDKGIADYWEHSRTIDEINC